MKKFIVFFVLAILAAQSFYIFNLRKELNITKDENKSLKINKTFVYTNNLTLPEPSDMSGSTDIIERLEMLDSHSVYGPSSKWISDVLKHAKREIIILRSHQMLKTSANSHSGHCTRYSSPF